MDESTIRDRLSLGEDGRTEFKSGALFGTPGFAGTIGKSVVCLANAAGGHLWIGVEDDGKATGVGGVEQADKIMLAVSQVCRDAVEPPLACVVTKERIGGAILVLVEVPAFSPVRPFRSGGRFYRRDGVQCRDADGTELRRLLESVDFHFDEQPAPGADRSDLGPALIEEFLAGAYGPGAVGQTDKYLRALHAVDDLGRPTITGLLLFSPDPSLRLADARVTAVRFPGTETSAEFLDRKEIVGPLHRQLDQAVEWLGAVVPAPSEVVGTTRRELGVPPGVWREALSNALVHRDYRVAAQTVIRVFSDRVEIQNPGVLLNRLDLEGIKLGVSQRRNPNVASVMARQQRRESIGIGVPEIIRELRRAGLPEPTFEVIGGHFRLTIRYLPKGIDG